MSKDIEKINAELFYCVDKTPVRFFIKSTNYLYGKNSFKPANKFDLINYNIYCHDTKQLIKTVDPITYDIHFAELLSNLPIRQIYTCLDYHLDGYLRQGGDLESFIDNTEDCVLKQLKHVFFVKGDHNREPNYDRAIKWIEKKKQELIHKKKSSKAKVDHTFLQLFKNDETCMNEFIKLMTAHDYLTKEGTWNKALYSQGGEIRPIIKKLKDLEIIDTKISNKSEVGRIFNKQFGKIMNERNYNYYGKMKDVIDPQFELQLEQLKNKTFIILYPKR